MYFRYVDDHYEYLVYRGTSCDWNRFHSLSKQEQQVIDKKQPRLGNEPRINVPEDGNK